MDPISTDYQKKQAPTPLDCNTNHGRQYPEPNLTSRPKGTCYLSIFHEVVARTKQAWRSKACQSSVSLSPHFTMRAKTENHNLRAYTGKKGTKANHAEKRCAPPPATRGLHVASMVLLQIFILPLA